MLAPATMDFIRSRTLRAFEYTDAIKTPKGMRKAMDCCLLNRIMNACKKATIDFI